VSTTFRLDPGKARKPDGNAIEGMYSLDGDMLTVCYAPSGAPAVVSLGPGAAPPGCPRASPGAGGWPDDRQSPHPRRRPLTAAGG
jgi:hypothetical protein